MADEETEPVLVNVDILQAARGTAYRASQEMGGTLPPSEFRSAVVDVLDKVAEVFDRLMAHANEQGVGELDLDDLPDLDELLDDEDEDEEDRQFPPVSVTFAGDEDAPDEEERADGDESKEADLEEPKKAPAKKAPAKKSAAKKAPAKKAS